MKTFDYERIWQEAWGDMQRFGPIHRHHRRIFAELFKQLRNNEIQTIADIGCGEGSNLVFMRSHFRNASLYGFDLSQRAIEVAKSNVDAEFTLLDIEKEKPSRTFDLVFCSDVVEHLDNDMAALQNMRLITDKYALIATVQGRMRANEDHIGHVRNYDYGELQRKMEEAGFKVTKIIEWGYPLYSPLFRNWVGFSRASEKFSYGKYGVFKRCIANILYAVFLLNRNDRGDIIVIMAEPSPREDESLRNN